MAVVVSEGVRCLLAYTENMIQILSCFCDRVSFAVPKNRNFSTPKLLRFPACHERDLPQNLLFCDRSFRRHIELDKTDKNRPFHLENNFKKFTYRENYS